MPTLMPLVQHLLAGLLMALVAACSTPDLPMTKEITVHDLHHKLITREPFVLLDVREADEVAVAHIAGSLHIPMGEIPGRLHELDPEQEIVVYCHHGIRSLRVANFLLQRDFERVVNLAGGIDAWAAAIEPGMTRY